jgi:DNA-binding winged helix-turn-helix (wHTH) protein/tetratricopeptide (TPR) repeat protein/TolB-like protein
MQVAESGLRTRSFSVFEVDLKSAELRKHGIRIKLQEQPFQILAFLLEHPGDVVSREELRQKLWPAHTFVDFDRSLNKAMTKLRSALGDSAESPRYIETVPRHGYRFLVDVRTPKEERTASSGAIHLNGHSTLDGIDAAAQRPRPLRETITEIYSRTSKMQRRTYGIAAVFLIAILATIGYLQIQQRVVHGVSSTAASPRRSVAVIGFKNLSGDNQEAWLSTALSDWLMTELTAGEHLRAIPAESVVRMKIELALPDVDSLGQDTLGRIRKNLGTDYVVVGSYARLGAKAEGQVRLDLRLQDTQSGDTVGTFSEVGTEDRLLDLVSRAGEHLREKLGVRAVTKEEAAEVAIAVPSRPETARLYSEGLAKLRVFDALAARELLTKAIAAEPEYAPSHAALATTLVQLGYDGRAVVEAKKAFDLSSNLSRAERLLVEGRYREVSRDWDRAIEVYRALFDFFPDNLEYGLDLANAQVSANKWKEGLDTIAALRNLPSPLRDDPRIDMAESPAARSLGDTKRAEAALTRAADKARAAGASLLLARALNDLAWVFENAGKEDRVESTVKEAMQLYVAAHDQPGVASTATLEAIDLERQGDYLGAKKRYEESLGIYRETGNKASLGAEYDNLGDILLYLGDTSLAQKNYSDALGTYRDIGDQNGVALAQIGLGDVFLMLGKLNEAKAMYSDAAEICRQLSSRNRQALAMAGVARVDQFEGNTDEARKIGVESIAMLEDVGNLSEAERIRTQMSEMLLDEGKFSEAKQAAAQSIGILEEKKAGRPAASAKLLLAQALLAQGDTSGARKFAEQVMAAAGRSRDKELLLRSEIEAAQIQGTTGSPSEVSESIRRLNKVTTAAAEASLVDIALDARLAAGEIEVNRGDRGAGRLRLEGIERDSNKAGYVMIARRASAAMKAATNRVAN